MVQSVDTFDIKPAWRCLHDIHLIQRSDHGYETLSIPTLYSYSVDTTESMSTKVTLICPPSKETQAALLPSMPSQAGYEASSGVIRIRLSSSNKRRPVPVQIVGPTQNAATYSSDLKVISMCPPKSSSTQSSNPTSKVKLTIKSFPLN